MATEQEEARPIRLPAPPRSKSDRTASWDKTARLWDAATPAEMARQMKESDGDRAGRGASDSIAGSPAEQIESLSEIASGLQFSNDGSLVMVNEERRAQL